MRRASSSKMIVCLPSGALAVLSFLGTAFSQEASKPVININATGEKVVHFGVVVKDVDKVARRFWKVFDTSGITSEFFGKLWFFSVKSLGYAGAVGGIGT